MSDLLVFFFQHDIHPFGTVRLNMRSGILSFFNPVNIV